MSKPIFDDPVENGAADPAIIWNQFTSEWWMFYTNRRPHLEGPGVGWIHGCAIGVATSPDGLNWTYKGTVKGLDDPADRQLNTHWAPEVLWAEGQFHMFLSYVEGAPDHFDNVERHIYHLTSPDLQRWSRHNRLELSSNNVIDACVYLCPDGRYRLWYKDERQGSATWAARSRHLMTWDVEGVIIPGAPKAAPHEGPNVFELGGYYWMIVDEWRGQAVYRSSNCEDWVRQGLVLDQPGADPMDRCFARHADVVVQEGWAALYYFTHPEWDEAAKPQPITPAERRTTIHVAKIWVENGLLLADRDAPLTPLLPPTLS